MQESIDYDRIATAIAYLQQNFKKQPHLDEIAEKVNLSPFHFQRMFTEWAGVSPKKFIQYLSLEHAKQILKIQQTSIFETSVATGLSSPSRLHDLFIRIEGMSPGEFKNGGQQLQINYSYQTSPFGSLLLAATPKGVCYMAFVNDEIQAFKDLHGQFQKASFSQQSDDFQEKAMSFFKKDWSKNNKIKLHIKGSDFQIKVWEALLKIPMGKLSTYGRIAEEIEKPNAARAVGTAIGSNPVAFLIPCHRVIQSNGTFGNYMWGETRKSAIIGWEAAKQDVKKLNL